MSYHAQETIFSADPSRPDPSHAESSHAGPSRSNSNTNAGKRKRTTAYEDVFVANPNEFLGIQFRDLSDYAEIEEEGPKGLVCSVCHAFPLSVLVVIKYAWMAKYAAPGTLFYLEYGPLVPYGRVDLLIEVIEDQDADEDEDEDEDEVMDEDEIPVPPTPRLCPVDPGDGATLSERLAAELENGSMMLGGTAVAAAPIDKGKGIGHPRMNHDYWGEFQNQFRRGG